MVEEVCYFIPEVGDETNGTGKKKTKRKVLDTLCLRQAVMLRSCGVFCTLPETQGCRKHVVVLKARLQNVQDLCRTLSGPLCNYHTPSTPISQALASGCHTNLSQFSSQLPTSQSLDLAQPNNPDAPPATADPPVTTPLTEAAPYPPIAAL